jgi:hypothetical protein
MTTKDSTARVNAVAAVKEELIALGANNGELADHLAKWSDLTSGRRPGYYAAHVKVVDEFRAVKGLPALDRPGQSKPAPEPTAPVIDDQAFEAAAPEVDPELRSTPAPMTDEEVVAKFGPDALAPEKPAKGKGKGKTTATATKPAAPKPEKAPARKVETVKNAPGNFLRQRRLVRRSHTSVAIFDLGHADNTFGEVVLPGTKPVEGEAPTLAKYLVVCEDHDTRHGVKNYESAWRAALDPAGFCPTCKKAAKA